MDTHTSNQDWTRQSAMNSFLPLPDVEDIVPEPFASRSSEAQEEMKTILLAQRQKRDVKGRQSYLYWHDNGCALWNEIAGQLISEHDTQPPLASRVYALLSVAQHDALLLAQKIQNQYKRPHPATTIAALKALPLTKETFAYPSELAVIAGTSAEVLAFIYPGREAYLKRLVASHLNVCLMAGANRPSDLRVGEAIGRRVGQGVVQKAKQDGANRADAGEVQPVGPGYWTGANPVLPGWGHVQPWFPEVAGITLEPPPTFGSPAFKEALAEVRHTCDTVTEDQLRCAKRWAMGVGTVTPPGLWNYFACQMLRHHQLDELDSARVLALLNTAMMDAGICCWKIKYRYWYIRPYQADTGIEPIIGLPQFPSYPSGHAIFSGAAAVVLSYHFPAATDELWKKANEASLSRLYGGIHYRFDCDRGLEAGKRIGEIALKSRQA